jgi:hypothetical protein
MTGQKFCSLFGSNLILYINSLRSCVRASVYLTRHFCVLIHRQNRFCHRKCRGRFCRWIVLVCHIRTTGPGPAKTGLHFRSYLLLLNLHKLLSTKQTDTVENVTAAPRGRGGGRHGQGILINERTNFKFSRTVTFDFSSPRHLRSCFLFLF